MRRPHRRLARSFARLLGSVTALGIPALLLLSCSDNRLTAPGPHAEFSAVPARVDVTPIDTAVNALLDTVQYTAVVYDESDSIMPNAPVIWTTSDTSRAKVDSTGKVVSYGRGRVTIRARAGSAAGHTDLVVRQVVSTFTLNMATDSLLPGDTLRLIATVRDSNNVDVAGTIKWVSHDTVAAVVDSTGLVTAIASKKAKITARISGNELISDLVASTIISVGTFPSVTASPDSVVINAIGFTTTLTADAHDFEGNALAVTWRSLDPAIATVDSVTGEVTAVAVGRTKIVAAVPHAADTVIVRVHHPIASVTIDGDSVMLTAGDSAQLTAVAADSNGVIAPNARIRWHTRDTTIVRIDSAGVVKAIAAGRTAVIAADNGIHDTLTVIVNPDLSGAHAWNGGAGDWADVVNWTPASVPGASDSTSVNGSGSVVTLSVDASSGTLTVGTGAAIAGASHMLSINGGLMLSGVITGTDLDVSGTLRISDGRLILQDQRLIIH